MSEEAFIYEAIRTPRGKNKNGALNEVKPVNLVVGLDRRTAQPSPRPGREPDQRPHPRRRLARRRPGRRHRPHGRAGGQAARDHRRIPAQPLLRVRPGGRQHRRTEGALRLGRPGAGRRRRVDEPRPDGLRRRRMGHRPRDQLPHRLRPAGHRRRPDRHHRGLLPRGRRPLRAALAGEGRRGMVGRLLRQVRRPGARPERSGHPRPRRAHAARHHARGPRQAEDRVRRRRRDGRLRRRGAAEVPLRREDQPRPHRRQQLRHRRRRRAGARRFRDGRQVAGSDPARAHRGHRHQRRRSRSSC